LASKLVLDRVTVFARTTMPFCAINLCTNRPGSKKNIPSDQNISFFKIQAVIHNQGEETRQSEKREGDDGKLPSTEQTSIPRTTKNWMLPLFIPDTLLMVGDISFRLKC
jgi:hypothetical protein